MSYVHVGATEAVDPTESRAVLFTFLNELRGLPFTWSDYEIIASTTVNEPALIGSFVRWPARGYVAAKAAWNQAVRHLGSTPNAMPFATSKVSELVPQVAAVIDRLPLPTKAASMGGLWMLGLVILGGALILKGSGRSRRRR